MLIKDLPDFPMFSVRKHRSIETAEGVVILISCLTAYLCDWDVLIELKEVRLENQGLSARKHELDFPL